MQKFWRLLLRISCTLNSKYHTSAQNSIEYFYPTIENVMYGRYPISRPLYLYTNGEPKGIVKDFIDYALSEEGQKVVVETAFVPIKK